MKVVRFVVLVVVLSVLFSMLDGITGLFRGLDGSISFRRPVFTSSKPKTKQVLPWNRHTCQVHDVRMGTVTYQALSGFDVRQLERKRVSRGSGFDRYDFIEFPDPESARRQQNQTRVREKVRRAFVTQFPYAMRTVNQFPHPDEFPPIDEESDPPRYVMWHCPKCEDALFAWLSVHSEVSVLESY